MNQMRFLASGFCGAVCSILLGCSAPPVGGSASSTTAHYQDVATQIDYPAAPPGDMSLAHTPAPRTIHDLDHVVYCDLTIQEAIRSALCNSRVLLDLGGTI